MDVHLMYAKYQIDPFGEGKVICAISATLTHNRQKVHICVLEKSANLCNV